MSVYKKKQWMKRKRQVWDHGEESTLPNMLGNCIRQNMNRHIDLLDCRGAPNGNGTKRPLPNLLYRKSVKFTIEDDKRIDATTIVSNEPENLGKGELMREMQLYLPDFLQEAVWERHQYSLQDILQTLHVAPKATIWQVALFYNIHILNSASKPSSSSSASLIYGGKSSAVKSIMKEFEKAEHPFHTWRNRPSALLLHPSPGMGTGTGTTKTNQKDEYNAVPLPYHFITCATMSKLQQLLPVASTTTDEEWMGEPIRTYENYVVWQKYDLDLVPLAVYGWPKGEECQPKYTVALLNRVLPYDALCQEYQVNGPGTPLSETLDMVLIQGNRYALMDEAFYVIACAEP